MNCKECIENNNGWCKLYKTNNKKVKEEKCWNGEVKVITVKEAELLLGNRYKII